MKKYHLLFIPCLMAIQISFCQEFKVDERTQMEKEDPMKIYNLDETSILDLLEMIEVQGVRMNKFEFGNFDKDYKILLLSDKYDSGNLIKTDTLGQFESTYRYYEEEKPYYDYMDKIKIITKDDDTKSELFIKTYAFSSKAQIELKRTNKNSFFNWRNYKNTDWKLNKKIPLMVFASSWKDEKYGFDRFCGVAHLTDNGKETNELLAMSPSYVIICYQVTEK